MQPSSHADDVAPRRPRFVRQPHLVLGRERRVHGDGQRCRARIAHATSAGRGYRGYPAWLLCDVHVRATSSIRSAFGKGAHECNANLSYVACQSQTVRLECAAPQNARWVQFF